MSSRSVAQDEKAGVQSGIRKCLVIICYLDSLLAMAYYLRLQSQNLFGFVSF